jgi:hypothetical protein
MAKGKKPRMIGKGAVGPVTHAPVIHKNKIRLPGQAIPGNKVPKGAGVTGNPKVMAWSPQAREAAIIARRAKAHGKSRGPKIVMNGHHGVGSAKNQPVARGGHHGINISQQTKSRLKKSGKVAANAASVAVTAYAIHHAVYGNQKNNAVRRQAMMRHPATQSKLQTRPALRVVKSNSHPTYISKRLSNIKARHANGMAAVRRKNMRVATKALNNRPYGK